MTIYDFDNDFAHYELDETKKTDFRKQETCEN